MALVQCPECASQVSDQATACPKCGYPLAVKPQPVNLVAPRAGIGAQTGAFWRCASCGKHVPNRQDTCVCGAARPETVAAPVASRRPVVTITPQFSTTEDRGSSAPWAVAVVLLGGLVLAGLFYASKNAGDLPKAGVARDEPAAARGPETYFLPAAGGSPSTQVPGGQPSSRALTPAEQVEQAAGRYRPEGGQMPVEQPTRAAPPSGERPSQDQSRQREEARRLEEAEQRRSEEERATAATWRAENERVVGGLREALASYQIQLCNDMRGAQTLYGGGEDMRSRYLLARSLAQDFEERARKAGLRSLVDIRWEAFPEPEPGGPPNPDRISGLRVKWKCPKVY